MTSPWPARLLDRCSGLARRCGRALRYRLWVLNGSAGPRVRLGIPQKATALIVYHNPARVRHLRGQVRNLLRCEFIERVAVVSHNPDLDLASLAGSLGDRVTHINSPVAKGCGDRWTTARTLDPEYLIVIDDDMLLFSRQVARVFLELVRCPDSLHGVSGMLQLPDGGFEYHDREDTVVDFLCEVYALTREQLHRYAELEARLAEAPGLAETVRSCADFVVVSRTGQLRPRIHDVGRLFRCASHKQSDVAVHQREGFWSKVKAVRSAMENHTAKQARPDIPAETRRRDPDGAPGFVPGGLLAVQQINREP